MPQDIFFEIENALDGAFLQRIWWDGENLQWDRQGSYFSRELTEAIRPFLRHEILEEAPTYQWIEHPTETDAPEEDLPQGSGQIVNACPSQIVSVLDAFYELVWRAKKNKLDSGDPESSFVAAQAAFDQIVDSPLTPQIVREVLNEVNIVAVWYKLQELDADIYGPIRAPYKDFGEENRFAS